MKTRLLKLALCLATGTATGWLAHQQMPLMSATAQSTGAKATQSSPVAVSASGRFVWVANPDTDSVSVIDTENDAYQKVAEIKVGDEPNNLALSASGRAYVANTISGTVSVINAATREIITTIAVGTEPYGIALTPNGRKLYVVNARSNDVSVIDTATNGVVRTITSVGTEPRGIAITSDGDTDDNDEKVYVAEFNGVDIPGKIIGADDYKEGRVTVIAAGNDAVLGQVVLPPMENVGFNSNGSALKRIAATTPPTFTVPTGAFPNSLNAIAIKGGRAYLPNNAASADGPVRFNVNVQAFLNVIDTATDKEGIADGKPQTINMNRGIQFEPASPQKLFLGMPWHLAFENNSNEGWVVASAANILVKVVLDANGTPTINAPAAAGQAGNIIRIPTGQKPIGVAISPDDKRAYVANEVSRDLTVVNLDTNEVITTVSTAALPTPGTLEATVQYGKAIFYSSASVNLPTLGPVIPAGRLSSEGWSGCVSCHANGFTDQVVWIFGAGPRRSVPLHSTFNPQNPNDQKILNYSAIFDEVQDFENNIRGVSGGLGLITLADGVTQDPVLNAFALPNTGRSAPLDALATFIARGIRAPISPARRITPFSREGQEIQLGRKLFVAAGCVDCHAGGGWSSVRRSYVPPPVAADVVNGQIIGLLRQVGTFNAANINEIRQNGAPPLGADGYAPPSLLGAWAMGPLLHNGTAITIDDILDNVTHRRAGQNRFQADPLNDARHRDALIKFLKSIDAATQPFNVGFN
jgi:YVTN family beta-propeller protein